MKSCHIFDIIPTFNWRWGQKKQVSVIWFGCLWFTWLLWTVSSLESTDCCGLVPSSGFQGAIVIVILSPTRYPAPTLMEDWAVRSRGHHSLLLLPVQNVDEAMCQFRQQCQGKSRYLVSFLLGSRDTGTSVRKCPLQPTVCCDYRSLTGTWSWKDHRRLSYSDLLLVAI